MSFGLEPGLGLAYHLTAEINKEEHEVFMYDHVGMDDFSIGYALKASLSYKTKTSLFLGYSNYRMQADNFKNVVFGDSKRKVNFSNFKVGLAYRL